MNHIRRMARRIDVFVAPSLTVLRRFRDEFGIPNSKLAHLDYGFDMQRLQGRRRTRESSFVFGYIGTHIPAKGIPVLLDAFAQVGGNVKLRVWGRPNGSTTAALRKHAANLPSGKGERVEWMGGYDPRLIVTKVFNRVDAIVVPSIWFENSPLVIHEAQQARIPVIASNLCGMAEYVRHEVNGLLFEARNPADLAAQMQRFVDDPALARRLGGTGYLWSDTRDVQPIEEHVRRLLSLYKAAIRRRENKEES
jgi:glycosyltransferase involved in cell wall biosynthesis